MSELQKMRETWRPRLAHSLVVQNWIIPPLGFILALFQPDAGDTAVALVMAFYGLIAALFGIRQWGKNSGAENGQS